MNGAKKKRIIFVVLIIALVVAALSLGFAMGFFEKDSSTYTLLSHLRMGLLIALWVGIIAALIVAIIRIKKDNKLYLAALQSKNYGEAIEIFAKKAGTYVLYRLHINCKLYLVSLYLLDNRIDAARALLENDWKADRRNVLFFKILVSLYDGNIDEAKRDYANLLKLKSKNLERQQQLAERIFTCIDKNDFSDKFYLDSAYPIVKDIYDCYAGEENEKTTI